MGNWENSKKRKIFKTTFYSVFMVGLVSMCIAVPKLAKEPEVATVKAARRPAEVELKEVEPVLLASEKESEEPVESTMEIVNDTILSNVPIADYSYSFNENIKDMVLVTREGDNGGYNDGTYPSENVNKVPLYTDGMEGEAIYLDGTYGLELCGMKPLANSYTISFWIKAEELFNWSPFLVIGSNLLDANVSQNYISFNQKTTEEGEVVAPIFNTINATLSNSCEVRPTIEEKQCIHLDEWTYITIAVDGTQVSESDSNKVMGYLYVNSELVGSSEVSNMCYEENNMKAYLGISCFDKMFRACYDELHIWNQKLDENQISAMYVAYLNQA